MSNFAGEIQEVLQELIRAAGEASRASLACENRVAFAVTQALSKESLTASDVAAVLQQFVCSIAAETALTSEDDYQRAMDSIARSLGRQVYHAYDILIKGQDVLDPTAPVRSAAALAAMHVIGCAAQRHQADLVAVIEEALECAHDCLYYDVDVSRKTLQSHLWAIKERHLEDHLKAVIGRRTSWLLSIRNVVRWCSKR